jgi:hypothetical protein
MKQSVPEPSAMIDVKLMAVEQKRTASQSGGGSGFD